MSNMSYCRFENTLEDMQECLDAVVEREDLSFMEAGAKDELVQVCRDFVLAYEEEEMEEAENDSTR
jgi:hypothetical protein